MAASPPALRGLLPSHQVKQFDVKILPVESFDVKRHYLELCWPDGAARLRRRVYAGRARALPGDRPRRGGRDRPDGGDRPPRLADLRADRGASASTMASTRCSSSSPSPTGP